MASIPFSGVSLQAMVDNWTPSLESLPSWDSITPMLDSITPEMVANTINTACYTMIIADIVILAALVLNRLTEPKIEDEIPSRDIVPFQGPVTPKAPQIPVCSQCQRSMGDFQVIVIDPFADINLMFNEFFCASHH